MSSKGEPLPEGLPEDPENLLPDQHVLSLDEYLSMHRSIGERTRFEIVYRLVQAGDMSPTELVDRLGIDDSTLHYHLNQLIDVGLVEKRKRAEPTSEGLYTYYRATDLADVLLEHGLAELLRREWDFVEAYSSG